MLRFLSNLFGRPAPIQSAPGTRRIKVHSADSGYVYQYFFEAFREQGGYEYFFQASADRRSWRTVAVLLPRDVVEDWTEVHGRDLSASERFGIAKVALRQAFDVAEAPAGLPAQVRVGRAELTAIAEFLDIP